MTKLDNLDVLTRQPQVPVSIKRSRQTVSEMVTAFSSVQTGTFCPPMQLNFCYVQFLCVRENSTCAEVQSFEPVEETMVAKTIVPTISVVVVRLVCPKITANGDTVMLRMPSSKRPPLAHGKT